VLEIASVIGWFDIDIIRELTRYNEGEIIGLVGDISRLLQIKYSKDRIEFGEQMSRNALYRSTVEGVRGITLHRLIGERIETRSQGREHEVA